MEEGVEADEAIEKGIAGGETGDAKREVEAAEHEGEEEGEGKEAAEVEEKAGAGAGPEFEIVGETAEGKEQVAAGLVEDEVDAALHQGPVPLGLFLG
ncbi:MAG: hypothetical protein GY759_13710 [Chloroflexi bacterium]|nr:hypothetical protein [Chloroflexota bacterium]